jgi:oligoribonuclease (3'-5' exoribonuclease)
MRNLNTAMLDDCIPKPSIKKSHGAGDEGNAHRIVRDYRESLLRLQFYSESREHRTYAITDPYLRPSNLPQREKTEHRTYKDHRGSLPALHYYIERKKEAVEPIR